MPKQLLGFAAIAALIGATALPSLAQASVLAAQTQPDAQAVELYGTFHDARTDFVFVKLPSGWTFVAKDEGTRQHDVFLDAGTGFVFVKLSEGWRFVGRAA